MNLCLGHAYCMYILSYISVEYTFVLKISTPYINELLFVLRHLETIYEVRVGFGIKHSLLVTALIYSFYSCVVIQVSNYYSLSSCHISLWNWIFFFRSRRFYFFHKCYKLILPTLNACYIYVIVITLGLLPNNSLNWTWWWHMSLFSQHQVGRSKRVRSFRSSCSGMTWVYGNSRLA